MHKCWRGLGQKTLVGEVPVESVHRLVDSATEPQQAFLGDGHPARDLNSDLTKLHAGRRAAGAPTAVLALHRHVLFWNHPRSVCQGR